MGESGSGIGVDGSSQSGTGVNGTSVDGVGGLFSSTNGIALDTEGAVSLTGDVSIDGTLGVENLRRH